MHGRPIQPADVPRVLDFLAERAAADGYEAVGERKHLALARRPAGRMVEEGGVVVGVAPWVGDDPRTFEVAAPSREAAQHLVDEVVDHHPGGTLRAWSLRGRHAEVFVGAGFEMERRLLELHRPLPAPPESSPPDLAFRGYQPGDEVAWVAVNNRAFAGHPEQGGLDVDDFLDRTTRPWWRPEGLRLGVVGGTVVGFCWTKRHPDGVGEIYAIGVDPAMTGRGWGRALVAEGMRHLHEAEGCGAVKLFVDAANEAALGTYRGLGFDRVHEDVAFVLRR